MNDKKYILDNLNLVKERLALKGYNFDIENFINIENLRKEKQVLLENLQSEKNKLNKLNIPLDEKRILANNFDNQIKDLNLIVEDLKLNLHNILLEMPNLPDLNCTIGNDENDNKTLKVVGNIPIFNFDIKDHVDIGLFNQEINFELGTALAQPRFVVLKNRVAKLHRALVNFMLDIHTNQHQYIEFNLPTLVNEQALIGTGQLPKFKDDLFKVEGADLYLIPTAEVPLTNMFANQIVNYKQLPLNLTAHTNCYRSEAGAYGKDTRGMIRQHQFEKIELVKLVTEDQAEEEFNNLLGHAEKILQLLNLPYRVVELCTGDLGFGARKTYDIEVWIPSQNKYREISSCTYFADFQARRMNAKYKNKDNKNVFLHTINGSGLAVGRTLVAILENYQKEDGTFDIPEILHKYMY